MARLVLALAYFAAGYLHVVAPEPFLSIIPGWVPVQAEVVFCTGLAEIAGAAALIQPWSATLRKAGALALVTYAICCFLRTSTISCWIWRSPIAASA